MEKYVHELIRIIHDQERQDISVPAEFTDELALSRLELQGWRWVQAGGDWCNCLAFSLLIILKAEGILRGDISSDEEIRACRLLRDELWADPDLQPRNASGQPEYLAYLQAHVHSEACIRFLLTHFKDKRGASRLPAAGVQVFTHSRWDVHFGHPADPFDCCHMFEFTDAAPGHDPAIALPMHLFNWTGTGLSGFHYDALLWVGLEGKPILVADDDVEFAGSSSAPSTTAAASLGARVTCRNG